MEICFQMYKRIKKVFAFLIGKTFFRSKKESFIISFCIKKEIFTSHPISEVEIRKKGLKYYLTMVLQAKFLANLITKLLFRGGGVHFWMVPFL
jgi:hypothetical protein